MADARFDVFDDFLARGRRAQAVAQHLAYHGPGLTFGELAIGERFEWAPPIPRGQEPMVKTALDLYTWSRGSGTAGDYYRVERVPKVGRSAGGGAGASAPDPGAETLRRPADANAHTRKRGSR